MNPTNQSANPTVAPWPLLQGRPAAAWIVLGLIVAVTLLIRLYRLNGLPAEMWGDVIEHYELAQAIRDGQWFYTYVFGGDGALFSYLVAGVSWLFGLSFPSIKLTTALIGTGLSAALYFLAKQLSGDRVTAGLAAFLNSVAFWSICFSRQGKPYLLVALLATLALLFALQRRPLLAGLMLGLGLYTQIAFWGMLLVFVGYPLALAVGVVIASPMLWHFLTHFSLTLSSTSYLGEKFGFHRLPDLAVILKGYAINLVKNLSSLVYHGDAIVRHNVPGTPALDAISRILFLYGCGLILYRLFRSAERRQTLLFGLLLPFFLIQAPSLLDISNPHSTPNMGRMIGILPLVLLITALGLRHLVGLIPGEKWQILVLLIVLSSIAALNLHKYFAAYPPTLPNNNTPFGKIISTAIEDLPAEQTAVIVGCCWGEYAQPEPDSIRFTLERGRPVEFVQKPDLPAFIRQVSAAPGATFVFFANPADQELAAMLAPHFPVVHREALTADGIRVAQMIGVHTR
jgi:hypothetical protein